MVEQSTTTFPGPRTGSMAATTSATWGELGTQRTTTSAAPATPAGSPPSVAPSETARATGRASKASWASTPDTGQLSTLRAESPHACTVVRPTAANRRQIRGMSSIRSQWICTVWRVVRSA